MGELLLIWAIALPSSTFLLLEMLCMQSADGSCRFDSSKTALFTLVRRTGVCAIVTEPRTERRAEPVKFCTPTQKHTHTLGQPAINLILFPQSSWTQGRGNRCLSLPLLRPKFNQI